MRVKPGQRIHLIGISGIGLSAIARVLLARGYTVSGSDLRETEITRELDTLGAQTYVGHRPEQIDGADLVVASSAIPKRNCEIVAAEQKGIPVLLRREFLRPFLHDDHVVAVAGTHGKTTTSAMLATILRGLDMDPSFIVGGIISELGTNAYAGQGSMFVIEADEYDRMFHGLDPDVAVVTHLEMDHPDCYPTMADMSAAFDQFLSQTAPSGVIIAWDGSPALCALLEKQQTTEVITYGSATADYTVAQEAINDRGGVDFCVERAGRAVADVSLAIPGRHNALNATAALLAAQRCGADIARAAHSLAEFRGALRRFQIRGERNSVTVIDDYAHHPTEIRATLSAARACYGSRRIVAVYQPHTFSRTEALWDESLTCFADADIVLVTDVYRARAKEQATVSAEQLTQAIEHDDATYASTLDNALAIVKRIIEPGDVLITLGAGDVNWVGEQILGQQEAR